MTVVADIKGKDFKECQERNFGMPLPEGYRKALRLMKQAEKFNRPIISFVNTSGAFCGLEAEERGQGEAIARNLLEMSGLKVPVLCILIGEGGSGGALATAVGNEVDDGECDLPPFSLTGGFASILWKDSNRAQEASEVMNITAQDLKTPWRDRAHCPGVWRGRQQETASAIGSYMKEYIKEFLQKYDGKVRRTDCSGTLRESGSGLFEKYIKKGLRKNSGIEDRRSLPARSRNTGAEWGVGVSLSGLAGAVAAASGNERDINGADWLPRP